MVTFSDIGQRRADPSFQLNPQRSLLDPSMIGGGKKRVFKLHLIYPQKKEVERPGTVYDAPAGTGRGNYAHTGDWELNEQERKLLESRLRRSLEESGVKVQPGMETYHSKKGVDEFRTNWGPPTAELGIGNHEYPDEIVPVYLIRGMGAHAGGQPGAGFQNSYFTIGDGVMESLAGRKGIHGKTAYEIIKNSEESWNAEFHKFNSSYQAQMGTVLHEGFHAVAALPHNEEEMVRDYSSNYAGAHGEEFGKAIDDAMRGRAGTDKFAAMNLIMNEPWNYGWGQQAQGLPGQMPTTGRDVPGAVPRPGGVDEVTTASIPSTGPSGSGKYVQFQPGIPLGEIASTTAGAAQDIPRGNEMAQDDDLRLRYGTWERYLNGRWYEASDATQQWLSERYSGVTGTGNAQSFENIGYPETTTNRYTSRNEFTTSLLAAKEKGDLASPRDKSPEKSTRERFLEAWSEFSGGKRFPPYIENNPDFGLDGDVLRAFMTYFETVDPVASQPQSYTLDNGEVYTILPGGKVIKEGTKDPQTGALTKTSGSSEVFIDDATGRTFIRNPDGTIEYVPDQKVPTAQGEGTFKYDEDLGRFVITQPDGTIQFGPEPTQDAEIDIDASGRQYITQPDGTIQYLGREFEPGVIEDEGFNLLRQPSGAMTQLGLPPAPADTETIGGIQFIRTTSGELMPLDNVMKRMKENMVVTGNFKGAAAVHAWETRPSNQEYFDRMLQYVNAPADQLLVSAIARGQGLVAPPPEETIQRIGPPPEYLTEAFNMLRDQMRMGLPEGTKSFAESMAEQAEQLRIESLQLDNDAKRQNIETAAVVAADTHDAAVIANNATQSSANFSAANSEVDLDLRLNPPDDDDMPPTAAADGKPGSVSQIQWDYEQARDAYNKAMGWTRPIPGTLSPADKLIGDAARGGATIENMTAIFQQNTPGPEEQDISEQMPDVGPGVTISSLPGAAGTSEAGVQFPGTGVQGVGPQAYVSEEAEEEVAPLTFEEAVQSIGREGVTYAEPDEEEPEPVTFSQVAEAPPELGAGAEPFEAPVEMLTTEEALESFGIAEEQLGGYAGVGDTSAETPWEPYGDDDWFAGGGIYDDNTAIVGESGPELAIFPRGTEIVPLDRRMRPSQANRLRRRGVRGMQEGGIVFDNPLDSPLPLGIRQLQAGRSLGAPRGQLLRTAGIALPSAQARRRMLPSEQEAFAGLGRMAGIPAGEFQQELGITTPSGAPRTGSARMLPLSLRR